LAEKEAILNQWQRQCNKRKIIKICNNQLAIAVAVTLAAAFWEEHGLSQQQQASSCE